MGSSALTIQDLRNSYHFSQSGNLIVSETTNDHMVIGRNATNRRMPIADYKSKGNAGELDKWICLSVHSTLPSKTSYVYCNGKKLCEFTAKGYSSPGNTQMTVEDKNPSQIASLYGFIASFLLYKNRTMTERDIKLHHHVFCSWYNIDYHPITFQILSYSNTIMLRSNAPFLLRPPRLNAPYFKFLFQ